MTIEVSDLKERFLTTLQKASGLSSKECFALWAIVSTLIGASRFSLKAVSDRFGRLVGRNFLGKVLKKYSFLQDRLFRELVCQIIKSYSSRKKFYVVVDDTLLHKAGRRIFKTYKWYDHTIGRQVNAICLVTLALVVDDDLVFIMPWLLTKPVTKDSGKKLRGKEQGSKTDAAIWMIQTVVGWFVEENVSKERVVVLADSWFSSFLMRKALGELGVRYRIDGKINYTVLVPDHEAIKKARVQVRGRRRTRFMKTTPLTDFVGHPRDWLSFYSKEKNIRVYYNQTECLLNSGGRVLVYAYWAKGWKKYRFILTEVRRKNKPTPQTIFRDYRRRWWVEVGHQELKNQFGLSKSQSRNPWVVGGFLALVFFAYSVFKLLAAQEEKQTGMPIPCPTWAEEFNKEIIRDSPPVGAC